MSVSIKFSWTHNIKILIQNIILDHIIFSLYSAVVIITSIINPNVLYFIGIWCIAIISVCSIIKEAIFGVERCGWGDRLVWSTVGIKRVRVCNFSPYMQEAEKESAIEGLRIPLHEMCPGFAVFNSLDLNRKNY